MTRTQGRRPCLARRDRAPEPAATGLRRWDVGAWPALLLVLVAMLLGGCVTVRPVPEPACDPAGATIGTPLDLDFALTMPRGVADVQAEDPSEEAATVRFLATLPRVDALLVDNSLVLSQLHVERRRSASSDARGIPDLVVTALHIESLPGSELATFGPEVMAWLTLTQAAVAIMHPDKPSPVAVEIEGRTVQQTLWDDHLLAWFAHGEVLYIVLAANPQLLAQAVDELPAPRVEASGCGADQDLTVSSPSRRRPSRAPGRSSRPRPR